MRPQCVKRAVNSLFCSVPFWLMRNQLLERGHVASGCEQWAATPEWLDHPLTGDWLGHRECHVGGDFLLIYRLDDSGKAGFVVFVRSGTHSELFS